jgi:tRNA threonylcarbamoyl adenosine modification protein (Sua5/YciO/YrdC/YwlC family)
LRAPHFSIDGGILTQVTANLYNFSLIIVDINDPNRNGCGVSLINFYAINKSNQFIFYIIQPSHLLKCHQMLTSSSNPVMPETTVVQKSPKLIPEIIQRLQAGEVLILHTDTTYALIANGQETAAVEKILTLKQGTTAQPMALLTRKDQAQEFFIVDRYFEQFLEHFPYPVTLIVQPKENIPAAVANGFKNIFAVCPDQFVYDLIGEAPFPIAATSASFFGGLKAITIEMALRFFEGKVPYAVDGGTSKYGRSGTLIDLTVARPAMLTYGPVSYHDLIEFIPNLELPSHMRK